MKPLASSAALALAGVLLCASVTAGASERSELLATRGLAALRAGQNARALELFDEALSADPNDVHAIYYRAVLRARTGDLDSAANDLREALRIQPDFGVAALELGVVLIQAGDDAGAIAPLERAAAVPDLTARASFFIGIARLHLGQTDAARADLARAAGLDAGLRLPAEYYQGVAASRAGNWSAAEAHFNAVVAESPDSEIGRNAADFLARARGAGPAVPSKAYTLFGAAGFEYDSNVQLAPDDGQQVLGVSDKGDGRFVITAGGRYWPLRGSRVALSLGYEFYQSLHFDLTDFNLQDHRPAADLTYDDGPLHAGLAARYDYFLAKTDGLLSQFTGAPWLAYDESGFGRAEAYYRFRSQDYQTNPYEVLNGFNNSVGARQVFFLGAPSRNLSLGYRFDNQESSKSSGKAFEYNGHEIGVGLASDLPLEVVGQAFYAFRYEDYAGASDGRKDHEHQIVVSAERPITDFLSVQLAYFGTINDSNQDAFQYDRNVVSFLVWVRY